MTRSLLVRGMFVGLLAGLLAFAFAYWAGEPEVERSIAFETTMDRAAGRSPEPEMVSRKVQKSLGRVASLGIQAVMWATLGLLFGWLTERDGQWQQLHN
jgi:predicted cobalt transporter CbtA